MIRSWLALTFLLLVPDLARADGLERPVVVARAVGHEPARPEVPSDPARDPREPDVAQFTRSLEARVGEVLDRSVDLAAERAAALLEARQAAYLRD